MEAIISQAWDAFLTQLGIKDAVFSILMSAIIFLLIQIMKRFKKDKEITEGKVKKREEVDEHVTKLIVALSGDKITDIYTCAKKQGYCTVEQKEQLDDFFKPYHGLNGNGTRQRMYEEAMEMPLSLEEEVEDNFHT